MNPSVYPEIILMDKPCATLDFIVTVKVEELIDVLKQDYCVIIVTHSMVQASRVSDYAIFIQFNELMEYGETSQIVKIRLFPGLQLVSQIENL